MPAGSACVIKLCVTVTIVYCTCMFSSSCICVFISHLSCSGSDLLLLKLLAEFLHCDVPVFSTSA